MANQGSSAGYGEPSSDGSQPKETPLVTSTTGMTTVIEDPKQPLVGTNGGFQMYTIQEPHGTPFGKGGKTSRKYENVGYRLAKRKELYQRRKVICDFALAFALIGIMLMIVETELILNDVYKKTDTSSLLIKSCITISTVTLLGFVVWYHMLDVKLFMCDNSVEDWRLAMSWQRNVKIGVELFIYAIHPIPGNYDIQWTTTNPVDLTETIQTVPIDVLFSIPMFLRLFLVCRVMMLHSRLFTDASSQSLGALNRIHFNFKFIFKSMMTLYPEYVLLVLMLSCMIVGSWMMRACEMYHDNVHTNFLNSMWLIAITFLSVGYGDIVPNTYCGRGISVLTGIFGAGVTALVVAVLARKLELSRAEKYVHNFVIDVELDKRYKHAAANILKAGWLVYKNKKMGKLGKVLRYQKKLLRAIHSIRDVKQGQHRLQENTISVVEMYKTQTTIDATVKNIDTNTNDMSTHIAKLEQQLENIDRKLNSLCTSLRR